MIVPVRPAGSYNLSYLLFSPWGRSDRLPALFGLLVNNLTSRVIFYTSALAISPRVGVALVLPFIFTGLLIYLKRARATHLGTVLMVFPIASSFKGVVTLLGTDQLSDLLQPGGGSIALTLLLLVGQLACLVLPSEQPITAE